MDGFVWICALRIPWLVKLKTRKDPFIYSLKHKHKHSRLKKIVFLKKINSNLFKTKIIQLYQLGKNLTIN